MHLPLKAYRALLSGYLTPHWLKVACLAVLLLADVGLQLINPLVMRRFLDSATAGGAPACPRTERSVAGGPYDVRAAVRR